MRNLSVYVKFMVAALMVYSVESFGDGAAACPFQRVSFQTEILADEANVVKVAEYIKAIGKDYIGKIQDSEFKSKASKYVASCERLTDSSKEASVSITLTDEAFSKQKRDKSMALAKASRDCLDSITYTLGQERGVVQENAKCSMMPDVIDKEIASLERVSAINDRSIELLKKEVDPEKPIKNFTPEQLAEIEAKHDFSSVASESTHYGLMELGVSFMPEYDADGNNKGFKETNFFGILRLNNRFQEISFDGVGNLALYQELDVAFYSAPVACTDKKVTDAESSAAADADAKKSCVGNTPIENIKFKDISNTVNASIVGSALYKNPEIFGSWEVGVFGRKGILNREKKGGDGDSVAQFYNWGIEVRLNDPWAIEAGSKYHNGIPRYIFNWGKGTNEDFAGTGKKAKRKLASFNYRIFENQPVFLGLIVDDGKGPDTIALNLSYGLKASSVFGLFAN